MKYARGFTVLELAIAFAILSVAVVAVYEALGAAMSQSGRLEALDSGIGLAESLLAENSVGAAYEISEKEGITGAYRWKVQTAPYSDAAGTGSNAVPLVAIHVRVTWGRASRGERVDLARLALANYSKRSP